MKYIWHIFIGKSVRAVLFYRISHWCYKHKLKIISHFFWSLNLALHSIEISPLAVIGKNFKIAHTVGIVIGGGVIIKDNVTIYQNVTIGVKHTKSGERHYPIIENNAILYPGSVIIGDVTIGSNSIVAPNAVVTKNIPNNSIGKGVPAQVSSIK